MISGIRIRNQPYKSCAGNSIGPRQNLSDLSCAMIGSDRQASYAGRTFVLLQLACKQYLSMVRQEEAC